MGNNSDCYIEMKRLKKPRPMFTKEEIIEVLKNGNDNCHNRLIINKYGYVELVQPSVIGFTETMKYPLLVEEFNAKENMVEITLTSVLMPPLEPLPVD